MDRPGELLRRQAIYLKPRKNSPATVLPQSAPVKHPPGRPTDRARCHPPGGTPGDINRRPEHAQRYAVGGITLVAHTVAALIAMRYVTFWDVTFANSSAPIACHNSSGSMMLGTHLPFLG